MPIGRDGRESLAECADESCMTHEAPSRKGSCGGDCTRCGCGGGVPVTVSAPAPASRARLRATLVKVGVASGMAGAFVLVAMLAEPGPSSASQGVSLPDASLATAPPIQPEARRDLAGLLGEMRGRTYRIEIVSGRGEPTYRVLTGDGRVLAEGLRADEVYTVNEHLTVDRFGDAPELMNGPLMLLEGAARD